MACFDLKFYNANKILLALSATSGTIKNKGGFRTAATSKMEYFVITVDGFQPLKLVSAIFYQIFVFSSNDRPSKTMKNVFYFI